MTDARTPKGWLAALRRFSGAGTVLFVLVFLVGTYRAHALSLVVGDDDLCSAMSYASGRMPAPVDDPLDLADDHHACCDLGLCLDASALPVSAPPAAALPRSVRRRSSPPAPITPPQRSRRRSHRPRDPPSA